MVVDKDAAETKGAVEISDLLAGLTVDSITIVSQEMVPLMHMSQFTFRNLGAGLTLTLITRRRAGFPLNWIFRKKLVVYIKQLPLSVIQRMNVQTAGLQIMSALQFSRLFKLLCLLALCFQIGVLITCSGNRTMNFVYWR